MKSIPRMAAVALFLGATAGNASADLAFSLSGVTLAGGGTLTGSFMTDNALKMVTSFDITASASGSFAGFHYTTANSSVTASVLPSQYFQIDSTHNINELRLYLTGPLTSSGATLATTSSYEHEPSGGNRLPTAGSIVPAATVATPEPSTIALALTAAPIAAVWWARRRRRAG